MKELIKKNKIMKNINLFVPKFRKDEIFEHMEECLDKGWTGLGFKTIEIEEKWKKYTGFDNSHFLNSNTSGLHLAVKILKDVNKWGKFDEIITTPMTFISTNHAIMYEGLKPIFADVDEYLCLDPKSVEKKITKRTRAVLFVGIGGNTGRYKEIKELCEKHNLKLILDAAHMSGTFIKNEDRIEHVGLDADVTVFSFQAVKNLPTADSGMICFKNKDYDSIARKLSWLGIDKDTFQRTNDKGIYKWEYDLIDVGFKYHGNSMMASMGLVGLKYLEEDNNRRREICKIYEDSFEKENIKTIKIHPDCLKPSRHLYQIVIEKRNQMMEFLNLNGIYPGVHYRDNTNYRMYNEFFGTCPNSHNMSERIISLPLHVNLSDDDVKYVIDKVIEGYRIFE
jgi:dTDP-4-amino-4,6-dideoxygalactose transaminase